MNAQSEPLRLLAQERGRLMGELGVRPEDASWVLDEADAIASLTTPSLRLRLPGVLARLWRKLIRAAR